MAQYVMHQYKMYKSYLYVQSHAQYKHVSKQKLRFQDEAAVII